MAGSCFCFWCGVLEVAGGAGGFAQQFGEVNGSAGARAWVRWHVRCKDGGFAVLLAIGEDDCGFEFEQRSQGECRGD